MSNNYSKTPVKMKYDGIHDNAEISWNGRAYVVSDISDDVVFGVFFDPHLDDQVVSMLKTINQSNQEGKDLGDVIPCDCLEVATINAIINRVMDTLEHPMADPDTHIDEKGHMRGKILAEEVIPDYVRQAEEYLTEIGHEDEARNALFGSLNKLSLEWEWPVDITINGEEADLTCLKPDAVRKILSDMLYNECQHGMW